MSFLKYTILPKHPTLGMIRGEEMMLLRQGCFSPFLNLWLVVVLSFSNKLPELHKFVVQVQVVIIEER